MMISYDAQSVYINGENNIEYGKDAANIQIKEHTR
jgi:hypothetical protein